MGAPPFLRGWVFSPPNCYLFSSEPGTGIWRGVVEMARASAPLHGVWHNITADGLWYKAMSKMPSKVDKGLKRSEVRVLRSYQQKSHLWLWILCQIIPLSFLSHCIDSIRLHLHSCPMWTMGLAFLQQFLAPCFVVFFFFEDVFMISGESLMDEMQFSLCLLLAVGLR
jgi:hypothetical protein